MTNDISNKKVLIAMSGGVDSSAAAVILKEQGWDVVGATMLLHGDYDPSDAQAVAEQLNIPFHVIDLRSEFKAIIIDSFVEKYKNGLTPNPCVDCNREIKFGLLWEKAKELGCGYMATGHYARIERDGDSGRMVLKKARFLDKDQSYFLHVIPKELLDHIIFPLGEVEDKDETRQIAEKADLIAAHKSESQDICFVPDGDYVKVLEENSISISGHDADPSYIDPFGESGFFGSDEDTDGFFCDREGRILGKHQGQYRYTIGQRKGLGIASTDGPLYVLEKDADNNKVILGKNEDLFKTTLIATDVNWLIDGAFRFRCSARIRYRHNEQPCTVAIIKENCIIEYDEPQRAITPGQAVVFYDGDVVLGGGRICSC